MDPGSLVSVARGPLVTSLESIRAGLMLQLAKCSYLNVRCCAASVSIITLPTCETKGSESLVGIFLATPRHASQAKEGGWGWDDGMIEYRCHVLKQFSSSQLSREHLTCICIVILEKYTDHGHQNFYLDGLLDLMQQPDFQF